MLIKHELLQCTMRTRKTDIFCPQTTIAKAVTRVYTLEGVLCIMQSPMKKASLHSIHSSHLFLDIFYMFKDTRCHMVYS